LCAPLLPFLGLDVAHRRVERVDHVQQSHLTVRVREPDNLDGAQIRVEALERKGRGGIAWPQLAADHRQARVKLKSFAPTLLDLAVDGHPMSVALTCWGPSRDSQEHPRLNP